VFDDVLKGFSILLEGWPIVAALAGLALGVIVGAIPGLTATMTIAILMPFTFFLPPSVAIGFLLGIYKGAVYGGSIPAILINTPGTAAAAATCIDGSAMARKGEGRKALQIALGASVVGDLLSTFVLIAVAAPLAAIAVKFSAPEYTLLFVFSLTLIAGVAGPNPLKGFLSAGIGALIGCVGMDPASGVQRYVFDVTDLLGGIPLVPLLIGMFALAEVLDRASKPVESAQAAVTNPGGPSLSLAEFRRCLPTIFRSTGIGTVIGALPGLGAEIACWIAYGVAKKRSQEPHKFGKGAHEGVAAAESSNNACVPGDLIPMLVFGIPGDVVTAVLLGAFIAQGITPGPLLFVNHGPVIYALYAILIITNIGLIFLGLVAIRGFSSILKLPKTYVYSCVTVLAVAGAYAINSDLFDVTVMFVGGLMGFVMRRNGIPVAPFIIAMLLSPMLENSFRQTLALSQGSLWIFVERPISLALLAIFSVLILLLRRGARSRMLTPANQ
jgi:putative tricarboxylic transport membrane protein